MSGPDVIAADSAALSRLPRCACGAPAFAFRAGTEAERQGDILSIRTGEPAALNCGDPEAAWCEGCWGRRFAEPAASAS